jgi:hypothetical protein
MHPLSDLPTSPYRTSRFATEAEHHRLARTAPPRPRRPLLSRISRALTDR